MSASVTPVNLFRFRSGATSIASSGNRREANAILLADPLGWEVRLLVGSQLEVVQTQVCRDQQEVLTTGEKWKAALVQKGWR